jgi:hypothetical protein
VSAVQAAEAAWRAIVADKPATPRRVEVGELRPDDVRVCTIPLGNTRALTVALRPDERCCLVQAFGKRSTMISLPIDHVEAVRDALAKAAESARRRGFLKR